MWALPWCKIQLWPAWNDQLPSVSKPSLSWVKPWREWNWSELIKLLPAVSKSSLSSFFSRGRLVWSKRTAPPENARPTFAPHSFWQTALIVLCVFSGIWSSSDRSTRTRLAMAILAGRSSPGRWPRTSTTSVWTARLLTRSTVPSCWDKEERGRAAVRVCEKQPSDISVMRGRGGDAGCDLTPPRAS